MGYNTDFSGQIDIFPPLNEYEIDYLTRFSRTRRMSRSSGPYFVGSSGFMGSDKEPDVIDYNAPPPGQPGLWCQWVPAPDGAALVWDEGEKFYNAPEWMRYLINHFLRPGAYASISKDLQFEHFTFDHVLNGTIEAQGDDSDDRWVLIVKDNQVLIADAHFTYDDPRPLP